MFKLYSTDDGRQAPWEYLPCSAIQPHYGEAMYMTGGKLALASGSNKAQYVCMREEDAAVSAGDIIPVVKIQPDQVWETVAAASGYSVGAGYDVHTDGLSIKLASQSATGNFVLNYVGGDDGKEVRGRFVL